MNINGLRVGAPKYSPETIERIKLVLSEMRLVIELPAEAIRESRFKSDPHVIWLMESGATEDEVKADINAVCKAGLIEAAKSDHWYKYEKDWGDDRPNYEEEVGDDCEVEEGVE